MVNCTSVSWISFFPRRLRFTRQPFEGAERRRLNGSSIPPNYVILLFFNSAFLDNRPPQKNSITVQLWFCLHRSFNFDLHLQAAPMCRPVHPVMNPDNEVFCSVPLKEHKHCSYGRPDTLVLSPLTSSVTWTRWCSCGEQMFGLCRAQMLRNPIGTRSCV